MRFFDYLSERKRWWMHGLLFCVLLAGTRSLAQPSRFVYIQSDNQRPFYISVMNQVTSSSSSGYAILPNLKDSTYVLDIGFPGQEDSWTFTVNIPRKDLGFVLKDFGEKGWGLFNWQSLDVIYGKKRAGGPVKNQESGETTKKSEHADTYSNDTFATWLAAAVDDPDIRSVQWTRLPEPPAQAPVTARQVPPPSAPVTETAKPTTETARQVPPPSAPGIGSDKPVTETVTAKTSPMADSAVERAVKTGLAQTETDSVLERSKGSTAAIKPGPMMRSRISRVLMVRSREAWEMVFVDHASARETDTIRLAFGEALTASPGVDEADSTSSVIRERESLPPAKEERKSFLSGILNRGERKEREGDSAGMKPMVQPPVVRVTTVEPVLKSNSTEVRRNVEKPEEPRFLDFRLGPAGGKDSGGALPADTVRVMDRARVETPEPMIHAGCAGLAAEASVDSLLVEMRGLADADERVWLGVRFMKKSCLTTEQVRRLAQGFSEEAQVYQWLDAAYSRVHDRDQYGRLELLLKSDYYRNRFRALLK